jgi:hypothetical protein
MENTKRKNDGTNRRRYWYFLLPIIVALGLVIINGYLPSFLGRSSEMQYCEHQVSGNIRVRLAFTYYSNDPDVDPNTWQNDRMAFDYMAFQTIVIPSIDYEVTRDSGATWQRFWHLENSRNDSPWCHAFSFLDLDNFWLWTRSSIAVTHDGGQTWIVQNGYEEWNTSGNMTIDSVEFTTKTEGQIVFVNWPDVFDPTLLTLNGGKIWSPDPEWTQIDNLGTPRP